MDGCYQYSNGKVAICDEKISTMIRKFKTAITVFRSAGVLGLLLVAMRKIWDFDIVAGDRTDESTARDDRQRSPGEIDLARHRMAEHLRSVHDNRVAYGPFKGLKLADQAWWGVLDAPAQILGTYERSVQQVIEQAADPEATFVDIGAGDGYFAIGALQAGLFARAICFETLVEGRRALESNAMLNTVEDRTTILGEANSAAVLGALKDVGHGVILCDIEGDEFDLLSNEVLEALQDFQMIVELHAHLRRDGDRLRSELINRAERCFHVESLRSDDIPVSAFPELHGFSDNIRLLAFSEGRSVAGEWMVLKPKQDDDA